jgi:hypothetical protein
MSGPKFDPTINLGHLITICVLMFGLLAGWYGLKEEVRSVKAEVTAVAVRVAVTERSYDRLAASIERLSLIFETSARIDERLKALERRN